MISGIFGVGITLSEACNTDMLAGGVCLCAFVRKYSGVLANVYRANANVYRDLLKMNSLQHCRLSFSVRSQYKKACRRGAMRG